MNIKKRILGFALAVTIILSGLNTVPERVKADTSNPKAQAEVIPSPAKSSATMAIGATKQIKINNLKKTTKVTYKSDKPKTVKVSKKGKITALRAGKANISITVRTKTGEIKYGYAVIVKKPSFKQKKLNLIKGKSKTLKIKNISKQAKVTWKSSNKKVASISAKGSIKAIKKGKADISAVIKVAGKTYTLKQKVTVNNKPTLAIKVSNKLDDKKKALIKTTDENIVIKGKITGKNKLKKLSITYTDHTNKPANIKPSGKRNWSVNVPLLIGRTKVKITAEGKKKEKITKVISINRTNKTIEYSANVKTADIKEAKEVSDSVVKSFRDDNNTSDRVSDDTIVVLVKEDSELLRKINAGELQQGNAYVLPQVEHFIAGFTGIYNRHQAPRDSTYPDYAYEEVIFNYPTIDKLFDKDINLDFSGGIDKENPVAFTLIGNKAAINPKANGSKIGMTNKVRAMGYGDDDKYPSPGFQREEFLTKLRFTGAINNGKGSLTLNWEDAVIYDKDGIRNKPGDDISGEIKFSGKIGLDDMYTEGGIEWHPDYIGGLFDHGKWLPDQMKLKLNYKKVANLELKGKTEFKTEEFVQNLNAGFENEASLVGLDISGVETFDKKWVIGAVGLRLLSKTGVSGNINQIAQQSSLADPIIMLFIFIDIDGNITVEGGIKTENSTSYVKGFNIQRNGFVGNYGSQAENFSAGRHSRINDDYTLDIYDSTENKNSFSVYGKATAGLKLGAGLGVGLMVAGLCPATVTGEVFVDSKMEAELEGKLEIPLKNSKIDGKANMVASLGAIAEADFRVMIADKPSLELKFHQEWPKSLGELINIQFPKEDKKKEDRKEEEKKEEKEEKKTKETTGKVAVKFKYDEVRIFSEEMAAVKVSGKWGFINKSGKEVIKPEYRAVSDFENGFARVNQNGSWGCINKEGKIIIPIKYEALLNFSEGLAGALDGFFIFTEAGYLDMFGNTAIPFKYGVVGAFSGGLAPASLSGKYGFIDRNGNEIIPFEYDDACAFHGYNIVPVKKNGKWGAIDSRGTEVIPFKYDDIFKKSDSANRYVHKGFREGMLSVKLNGKWGYVNQYGVEVIPMLFDEVATFFRGGMASVRLNDKWGYVNLSGDIVVQPKYDDVNDFFDDLTSVSLNGKWGYVDKAGKEIIPLKYDYAKEFNDGLGAVKVGDKWGYIDKTGKEVIPFIYEDADYFSENLAAVKKDGKWGFIKK